jgi:hypothetical protein
MWEIKLKKNYGIKKKPWRVEKHNSLRTKKEKKRLPNYIVPIYNAIGYECIVIVTVKPTTLSFYFIFVICWLLG